MSAASIDARRPETLRVAVNLTWIAPGRVGGSEEYLTRQLLGVPNDAGIELEVFASAEYAAAHPELDEVGRIVRTPVGRDNRALRIGLEHSWLAARTRAADVVHHGGGTVPLLGKWPVVLTVHDLQYLTFPEYFSAARHRYLDAMVPRSVRRAALVATPSEYVRRTVIEAFGADPERVVVVPHGIPELTVPGAAETAQVTTRLGIGARPWLVYPAITHPHKRHEVLVDMLGHLDDDTVLVLLGGRGPNEPVLEQAIEAAGVRDRVVRPGRVSDRDRDALIAGADALVFPSQYEGFGAPLVEAMALDTPVIAYAAEASCEVLGDAGLIIDLDAGSPGAGATWAAAVTDVRRRRDELVALGRHRRQAFTLERSGSALVDVYRRAAS